MRRRLTLALAALVLLVVGCVTGAAVSSLVIPEVRAGTNPPRWEYLCTKAYDDMKLFTQQANRMGEKGWEMVAGGPVHNRVSLRTYWCFKRPLP